MIPSTLFRLFIASNALAVVTVSASQYANTTMQIIPRHFDLSLAKRQSVPTEACVSFQAQVPCNFDDICCPAGTLCSGSITFVCVPAGAGDCPANTLACTNDAGCCPVGTSCTGDGHCDIDCIPADPVCGDGCCPTSLNVECDPLGSGQCVPSSGSSSSSRRSTASTARTSSSVRATAANASASAARTSSASSTANAQPTQSSSAKPNRFSFDKALLMFLSVVFAVGR